MTTPQEQQAPQQVLSELQLIERISHTAPALAAGALRNIGDVARRAIAALSQPAASASGAASGWRLVPVEPTPEMVEAWVNAAPHESDRSATDEEANRLWATADWQAMLNAAPKTGGSQ